MKTLIALFSATAILLTSHSVLARDISIDEAVRLRDSGVVKNFEELNKAALGRHPGGKITDTELEQEYGRYIYQVEIRDTKGVDWDLEFDASTGELLRDFRDD